MRLDTIYRVDDDDDSDDNESAKPVKHSDKDCREFAATFWQWVSHIKVPAIVVLPNYMEQIDPWNTNPVRIHFKGVGRIVVIGSIVVLEWLYTYDKLSKSHFLVEFESPAKANAFSNRAIQGEHQVLLAGHNCDRVVLVTSNPDRPGSHIAEDKGDAFIHDENAMLSYSTPPGSENRPIDPEFRNYVECEGLQLGKNRGNFYKFMEASSHEELLKSLANAPADQ